MKIVKMLAATAALLCAAAAPSLAQSWPQKTIRFIVPFPAGGGTDVVARLVAKNLQDKLGQTVIVENRGGANGAIGLMAVKQTVADGYTFAFTSDTPMTVNPWLYKDLSYQPLKDFVPVCLIASTPIVLMAHPSFTGKTVSDVIAQAKTTQLAVGTPPRPSLRDRIHLPGRRTRCGSAMCCSPSRLPPSSAARRRCSRKVPTRRRRPMTD